MKNPVIIRGENARKRLSYKRVSLFFYPKQREVEKSRNNCMPVRFMEQNFCNVYPCAPVVYLNIIKESLGFDDYDDEDV